MKHKRELTTTLVCMLIILTFVVGMRAGLHDTESIMEEAKQLEAVRYEKEIAELNAQFEQERKIEHIEVEYVYKPLPVDYETVDTMMPDESDAIIIAKTLYIEYGVAENYAQCSAVVWNILGRYDAGYGTIEEICTRGQYDGYKASNPVDADLYNVVLDVMMRWKIEKLGVNTNVGRTLPDGYLWFMGDGYKNTFRNAYQGECDYITP